MAGGAENVQGAAALRRAEATGKTGVNALLSNKKALGVAVFASFGGLMYGYQQGVLGQALVMPAFERSFPAIHNSSGATGWLTSILQLGGWVGALSSGITSEVFSRKHTIFGGALWCILGTYLCAGARDGSYLFAGRFFTGLGVGTLSAVGPLYNAELAPPEVRGFLVALQQFSTTIGIMCAYWIAYGTNYIGGTGDGQSNLAWRVPLIVQGFPAVVLAVGVWYMPFSPRLLLNKSRDDEALANLARLRGLPQDNELVQIEYLEIKSEVLFEREVFATVFPQIKTDSVWRREIAQYMNIFRTKDSFKRVAIAGLVMFFQQWSGIDSSKPKKLPRPFRSCTRQRAGALIISSVIYYAPIIFENLGLTSHTSSLLATGVVGIVNVVFTIPAILTIDKLGRRPLLLVGSTIMFLAQVIAGVIVAVSQDNWAAHRASGWGAVVVIWVYIASFAFSWGPASWILIAEIFPLSIRAKGSSIGASSNWMNNFIIAFIVPPMISNITYGLYLFFAAWLLIGGLFVYFFIPETRGKTLEEMDAAFGSHTSADDVAHLMRIQEEVGLLRMLGRSQTEVFEKAPVKE